MHEPPDSTSCRDSLELPPGARPNFGPINRFGFGPRQRLDPTPGFEARGNLHLGPICGWRGRLLRCWGEKKKHVNHNNPGAELASQGAAAAELRSLISTLPRRLRLTLDPTILKPKLAP